MGHTLYQQNGRGESSTVTLNAAEAHAFEQAWHGNSPILGSERVQTFIDIALDETCSPAIRERMIERLTYEINSPFADKVFEALSRLSTSEPNRWLCKVASDAATFFSEFKNNGSNQALIADSYFNHPNKWEHRIAQLMIAHVPRANLSDNLFQIGEELLVRVDAPGYGEWRGPLVDYLDS